MLWSVAGGQELSQLPPSIQQAEVLHAAGKSDEALDELRQAVRDVKEVHGDTHPDLLPLYDLASEILYETGQFDKAEPLLEKVAALRESMVSQGQTDQQGPLAATLLLLGKAHASRGEVVDVIDSICRAVLLYGSAYGPTHADTMRANAELEQAVELFEESLGPNHAATWEAQEELATVQELLGNYAGAARSREQLVERVQQEYGLESAQGLNQIIELARVMVLAGRTEEGIELLASTCARLMASQEDGVLQVVAKGFREVGGMQLAADQFSPAAASYRQAMRLNEDQYGNEKHPEVLRDRLAILRVKVARNAMDTDDRTDLEEVLEELRSVQVSGADESTSQAFVEAYLAAVDLLVDLRQYADAVVAAQQAVEMVDTFAGGIETPLTARCRVGLVKAMIASGEREDARPLAEDALKSCEQFYGPASWTTLDIMLMVADCAIAEEDVGAALRLVNYGIGSGLPRPDFRTEERLVRLVTRLSALLSKVGTDDPAIGIEKTDVVTRYLDLRESQFGVKSLFMAQTYVAFGNAYQLDGEWSRAAAAYEKAVDVEKDSLDQEHPEIAATLLPLSRVYRAMRRNEDAERVLAEALRIWEASVGPEHPVTIATVKSLALVYLSSGRPDRALPLMERMRGVMVADSDRDDEELASLLTRMAKLATNAGDKTSGVGYLNEALSLDWWDDDGETDPLRMRKAALTMAEISVIFRSLGRVPDARSSERKARRIAERYADSQSLLEEIDDVLSESS
jgi:tetratricopeptide (TPR) repeat protein